MWLCLRARGQCVVVFTGEGTKHHIVTPSVAEGSLIKQYIDFAHLANAKNGGQFNKT